MEGGSEAPRSDGNLGVIVRGTNCLAVQIFWGDVLARRSAQWEA